MDNSMNTLERTKQQVGHRFHSVRRQTRMQSAGDSRAVVPSGYVTSEVFRQRAIRKVNQFCDEHGIL
jgi:hypothetical protein